MNIRQTERDDFGAVMRLYRQLQPSDPVLGDAQGLKVFDEILANPCLQIFVLEDQGLVCAASYLNIIPNLTRLARPYAVIENVITDEDRRGEGLGKSLMVHVLEHAWAADCYKVMLLTGSSKESTHAFYKACGFSGGVKTGYVAKPT